MQARLFTAPRIEDDLRSQGFRLIAGIDEVGRGPLAGPVMAAAVILPPDLEAPWLTDVRDSKLLTPKAREELSPKIWQAALALGVGAASASEIDDLGIVPATCRAMSRAVNQLALPPDYLLIDALSLPNIGIPQHGLVHGDSLCLSIAAASIVAKVARDHLMAMMDMQSPGFGFARNKGYATPEHLAALKRLGPCPLHRLSFAPMRFARPGRAPWSQARFPNLR
ncbi:MAG: ribonuclease HII [Dehalococcoidia bacterium]